MVDLTGIKPVLEKKGEKKDLFVFLFLLWLLLNGRCTVDVIITGVAFSALLTVFCVKYMGYRIKNELPMLLNGFLFIWYVFILLWEIIKANFQVLRLVFSSHSKSEAVMVFFDVPLKSKVLRVLLANSITLTPGTISVEHSSNGYLVHCLRQEFSEGITESSFVRILMRMDKRLNP